MAALHGAPRGHHTIRLALTCLVVLALSVAGFAGFEYLGLKRDLQTSDILQQQAVPPGSTQPPPADPKADSTSHSTPDSTLLIMGLDSRVDVNGNPLPTDIYQALHAGDQSNGGLNANVLMLLHIPGNGARATEISIPRDDEVDLAGCPDKTCRGKIKQAYGLAADQWSRKISGDSSLTAAQKQKQARDAGRKAQIQTVENFLDVHIDHFVEVTMVAFYQLAQVVQPITVCLLEATRDPFSGANFPAGQQQLDAQQALAFVRQRRDGAHPQLNFTDLDRERRQQAFISSLATQLKDAGTLTNPLKLNGILDVVKQNTVIDTGLDPISLTEQAAQMAGGNVAYYTLPVKAFGTNKRGEDINLVDVAIIRATVKRLLTPAGTPPVSTPRSTGVRPSTDITRPGSTPTGAPTPIPASSNPAPTQLSELSGGGVPCVK